MRSAAIALAIVGALFMSAANSPVASAATSKSTKPVAKLAAATQPVVKTVVVNPGDYLTMLAEGNNTTVQRLYEANTVIENPDLIFPGQELKIPDEKEELAHRDMPVTSVVGQQVLAETQAASAPAPARTSYSPPASSAPAVAGGSVWDNLAACESGGNWSINTGNGYYGGLQFSLSSWQAVGGTGYPNQASREEQILRGQMLQSRGGWGNWPACTAKLGLY